MSVEVANESGVAVEEPLLAALARHVLDTMEVHPAAELSVLLVDTAAMTELHTRWMGEPGPTDVLAFPMDELDSRGRRSAATGGAEPDPEPPPQLLGDVVLCPQVAAEQARTAGHSAADELHLLATHGILHLLGYDHAEPADAEAMFSLQGELLSGWRRSRAGAAG